MSADVDGKGGGGGAGRGCKRGMQRGDASEGGYSTGGGKTPAGLGVGRGLDRAPPEPSELMRRPPTRPRDMNSAHGGVRRGTAAVAATAAAAAAAGSYRGCPRGVPRRGRARLVGGSGWERPPRHGGRLPLQQREPRAGAADGRGAGRRRHGTRRSAATSAATRCPREEGRVGEVGRHP